MTLAFCVWCFAWVRWVLAFCVLCWFDLCRKKILSSFERLCVLCVLNKTQKKLTRALASGKKNKKKPWKKIITPVGKQTHPAHTVQTRIHPQHKHTYTAKKEKRNQKCPSPREKKTRQRKRGTHRPKFLVPSSTLLSSKKNFLGKFFLCYFLNSSSSWLNVLFFL